jgi:glycine cleavage system H protein
MPETDEGTSDKSHLVVQMAVFKAKIPVSLGYSNNHLWLSCTNNNRTRCGFTSFATRALSDIYHIEWAVKSGDAVKKGQSLGQVESAKATSDIFAPVGGKLSDFNNATLNDPASISLDPYGIWLFEYSGHIRAPFSPKAYAEYLMLATGGKLVES